MAQPQGALSPTERWLYRAALIAVGWLLCLSGRYWETIDLLQRTQTLQTQLTHSLEHLDRWQEQMESRLRPLEADVLARRPIPEYPLRPRARSRP